jgi:transposase
MFNWFVLNRVLPHLWPSAAIIMDNCSTYRDPALLEIVRMAGYELLYLPPYSPDLNPIKQTFNVLKAWIRRHRALAVAFSDLGAFLRHALQEAISDVVGHYLESGYS